MCSSRPQANQGTPNWPGGRGAAGPPRAGSASLAGRIRPTEALLPTPALEHGTGTDFAH